MLKMLCCKKVFILKLSALSYANLVTSRAESICLVLRFPLNFCMLVVLVRPDMWNQVLDNAFRELAARWESEGIGFRLATDYRKAQERSRGTSGEAMNIEGSGAPSLVLGGRLVRDGWYNGSLDSNFRRHDELH